MIVAVEKDRRHPGARFRRPVVVDEDQARWVRLIFFWFVLGATWRILHVAAALRPLCEPATKRLIGLPLQDLNGCRLN